MSCLARTVADVGSFLNLAVCPFFSRGGDFSVVGNEFQVRDTRIKSVGR